MLNFHNLLKLIITFLLILSFTNQANAEKFPPGYPECWQDTENAVNTSISPLDSSKVNMGQNTELFLPENSKVGHKLILVDFTSPLVKAQIDWIEDRIFEKALVKTTPPYWKVSYLKIDDTPVQSQEIAYSQGRMKTGSKSKFIGEKTNTKCEGQNQIKNAHNAWFMLNRSFKEKFLKNYDKEAEKSLIFEYLFHILREPNIDFNSEYPVRELIIVSDLMQHSDRFSFYSHCKIKAKIPNRCRSFEKLLKKTKIKNYINDRKPSKESVKNLKVKILYVNHDYETRDGLSSSLLDLWANLFDHIGIEFDVKKDVVKQLDIK